MRNSVEQKLAARCCSITILLMKDCLPSNWILVPTFFNQNRSPDKRWLQITVDGTILSPRVAIKGSPYSVQTRGIDVVEDGGGLRTGVGLVGFQKFNVFVGDNEPYSGMSVERPSGFNPTYHYKSGNNQGVRHFLDFDRQAWVLDNAGERIFVDPFGFVGINKDTQATSTEVFGVYRDTSGLAGMMMEAEEFGDPYYGYAIAGERVAYHSWDDDDNQWKLYIGTSPRVFVTEAGNVGVGFSQPALKFMVNGDAGKPGGGSWANVSDRRLKKNIEGLDGFVGKANEDSRRYI